ncbi:MAG: FeoA family protein [Cytophagales bacterium]
MKGSKRLSELQVGEKATIVALDESEFGVKLMEMGCVPGCEIKLKYKAPLGDPACYCVQGYDLSLRLKEAASIKISSNNEDQAQ